MYCLHVRGSQCWNNTMGRSESPQGAKRVEVLRMRYYSRNGSFDSCQTCLPHLEDRRKGEGCVEQCVSLMVLVTVRLGPSRRIMGGANHIKWVVVSCSGLAALYNHKAPVKGGCASKRTARDVAGFRVVACESSSVNSRSLSLET